MLKKHKTIILLLLSMALTLVFSSLALADDTTVITDPGSKDLNSFGSIVAVVVNFIRYIGLTILVGYGYYHTISLGAAAKNANRRAQVIEGLGWTALAVLIFFLTMPIVGALKGMSGKL